MDKERRFPLILSSFWLKILALLTMTIDHLGYSMEAMGLYTNVAYVFRIIGRLALPLFCFMIAEGAIHTKSFNKYALRLGIMASIISIAILGSETIPFFKSNGLSMKNEGVIFIDLLLGAVSVNLLKQKKWYIKVLALLPLLYGVGSFIVSSIDSCGCYPEIMWFPYFMRTQYGWYGIFMIIGFYFAHFIAKWLIKLASQESQIPYEEYQSSNYERNVLNVVSAIILVLITFLYLGVMKLLPPKYVYFDVSVQLYAILSGVFILLYNGKRGYNKKWFQYGSYLYYVLHLPLVYLLIYLISLI